MTISNIAGAINAAHAGVEAAKREGVRCAIECGRLLHEAKATVSHGGWDNWVREHCTFSARTAQLYMRLQRAVATDPAKAQRVADLSLREAVAMVSGSKRRPPTDEVVEQVEGLIRNWMLASSHARIVAAERLMEDGDMGPDDRARFVEAARSLENAELFVNWIKERGGRAGLDMMLAFLEGGGDMAQVAKRLRKHVHA